MTFSPSIGFPKAHSSLESLSDLELAQVLAERLAIQPNDWHRLNRNRQVRAQEQLAAALVYLLSQQPDEAIPRVEQALGWLNRTVTAPPCPTHGQPKGTDSPSAS
ncbi:hypothetical protein GFS31_25320 [Leptolyngbya sp. BL0902]|uniref:DUF6439 family protein n=1 Tax=Leptolyngbya sp. BL0902 TaxID=1115757 RepID=UPI0018E76BD9|nr:DUF6439 family protein [Leptolyngbya sp. BL0902]QQE65842.1 hypothetical protein GFS31_25320 [Leptolyngbya sp. BL0902]